MANFDKDNSPYQEYGDFSFGADDAAPPSGYQRRELLLFLERASDHIRRGIGEDSVKAVILGGSLGAGEGTVFAYEGKTIFLSDIDLTVVVDSLEAHRRGVAVRSLLSDQCRALWPSAEFTSGISIGVYHTSEIPLLPAKPGVLDIIENRELLYGDEDILRLLPGHKPEDIPEEEGIRILENRIASFLGSFSHSAEGGIVERSGIIYSLSRVYTDILIALLVFRRCYRSGYARRLEYVTENPGLVKDDDRIPTGFMDKLKWATEYKFRPETSVDERGVPLKREACARDLIRAWECFASRYYGDRINRKWPEILKDRDFGNPLDVRLRLWREYLRRMDFRGKLRCLAGANMAVLRVSPLELAQEYAIKALGLRVDKAEMDRLRCPGKGFRFKRGDWDKCSAMIHSLWVDIVEG